MQTVLMKCGILFNILLWISISSPFFLIGGIPRQEYIFTQCVKSTETYLEPNFSLTANESDVLEFPICPIIVFLCYFSISDTYSFTCACESMVVTYFTNVEAIKEMKCSLYLCGLLFRTNIIIYCICFFTLCNTPTLVAPKIKISTTDNVLHKNT